MLIHFESSEINEILCSSNLITSCHGQITSHAIQISINSQTLILFALSCFFYTTTTTKKQRNNLYRNKCEYCCGNIKDDLQLNSSMFALYFFGWHEKLHLLRHSTWNLKTKRKKKIITTTYCKYIIHLYGYFDCCVHSLDFEKTNEIWINQMKNTEMDTMISMCVYSITQAQFIHHETNKIQKHEANEQEQQ